MRPAAQWTHVIFLTDLRKYLRRWMVAGIERDRSMYHTPEHACFLHGKHLPSHPIDSIPAKRVVRRLWDNESPLFLSPAFPFAVCTCSLTGVFCYSVPPPYRTPKIEERTVCAGRLGSFFLQSFVKLAAVVCYRFLNTHMRLHRPEGNDRYVRFAPDDPKKVRPMSSSTQFFKGN